MHIATHATMPPRPLRRRCLTICLQLIGRRYAISFCVVSVTLLKLISLFRFRMPQVTKSYNVCAFQRTTLSVRKFLKRLSSSSFWFPWFRLLFWRMVPKVPRHHLCWLTESMYVFCFVFYLHSFVDLFIIYSSCVYLFHQSIVSNRVFSTPDGQQTTFVGINSIAMMYYFLSSTTRSFCLLRILLFLYFPSFSLSLSLSLDFFLSIFFFCFFSFFFSFSEAVLYSRMMFHSSECGVGLLFQNRFRGILPWPCPWTLTAGGIWANWIYQSLSWERPLLSRGLCLLSLIPAFYVFISFFTR